MTLEMIDAYAVDMRLANRTPATIYCRTKCLHEADFDLRAKLRYGLDEADTDDLRWWMSRRPRWSDATRYTYDGHLRGFYRFATSGADPWLYANPTVDLPKPKQPPLSPKPVPDAELATAWELSNDWWRLILALGAFAGLRVMEILALRREDVDGYGEGDDFYGDIRIRHGKGNKPATVPNHPAIWRLVEPRGPGLLVVDPQPPHSSALSAKARKYFDDLGLPNVHLHMLRHTYATRLMKGDGETPVDIRTVQTLTRHATLASLAGYLQVADERRRRAVLTLPEIGAAA